MMKEKIMMKIKNFFKENIWLSAELILLLITIFAFLWKWSLMLAYRW